VPTVGLAETHNSYQLPESAEADAGTILSIDMNCGLTTQFLRNCREPYGDKRACLAVKGHEFKMEALLGVVLF